jgi:hypothetical protein
MEPQLPFNIAGTRDFHPLALEIFRQQYRNNPVYREFCSHLGKHETTVKQFNDIPFLPIEFFKSRKVICGSPVSTIQFTSSGTTGSNLSRHFVSDISIYEQSYLRAFEIFYGPVTDYCILALLPSYLEREGSSLIYMVRDLIIRSGRTESGFYLHNFEDLKDALLQLKEKRCKVLLIGVSYALLDFVHHFRLSLDNTIIMETGGMKGRKKELVREELHGILKERFGVSAIHSEYGMTELLSQAYSKGDGMFKGPPWMRIFIRDAEDPFTPQIAGRTGGVNIVDLANINSCSFIATQDLGKIHPDGHFEILGRFDNSDIRGCNLMVL